MHIIKQNPDNYNNENGNNNKKEKWQLYNEHLHMKQNSWPTAKQKINDVDFNSKRHDILYKGMKIRVDTKVFVIFFDNTFILW